MSPTGTRNGAAAMAALYLFVPLASLAPARAEQRVRARFLAEPSPRDDRLDFAVVEVVSADVLAHYVQPGKKLLLDREHFGEIRSHHPRIVVGSLGRVRKVFDRLLKESGGFFEMAATFSRQAWAGTYPGCEHWVLPERPTYPTPNSAVVRFEVSVFADHGPSVATYALTRDGGQWRVTKRDLRSPQ